MSSKQPFLKVFQSFLDAMSLKARNFASSKEKRLSEAAARVRNRGFYFIGYI
jgi:hypothetical protein